MSPIGDKPATKCRPGHLRQSGPADRLGHKVQVARSRRSPDFTCHNPPVGILLTSMKAGVNEKAVAGNWQIVNAELEPPDRFHLEAAEGWRELGNQAQAGAELDKIAPRLQTHPDVLMMRWGIYFQTRQWELAAEVAKTFSEVVPDDVFGVMHWAHALHQLQRTKEAREVLLPAVAKFPDDDGIRASLANCACRLGDFKEALRWLKEAIDLAESHVHDGGEELKLLALEDPDMEPLWKRIRRL